MGLSANYTLARFKQEVRAQTSTLSQQESGLIDNQLNELVYHALMNVRSALDKLVDDQYRVQTALTVGSITAGFATATALVAGTVYDFMKVSLFNSTFKEIPLYPRRQFDAYRRLYTGGVNSAVNITGATNASPIVITATTHGLATGDVTVIASVGGNTAANGTWTVSVLTANTFSLDGSAGNAAYTSGGTSTKATDLRNKCIASLYSNTDGAAVVDFYCGYATGAFPITTTLTHLATPIKETVDGNTIDLPDRWVPLAIDHCVLLIFRRLAKQAPADIENRVSSTAVSIAQMLAVNADPQTVS